MGNRRMNLDDKYRLMRTEPYKALKIHNGMIVVVIPNPCDLDCPDCFYSRYCTNELGVNSKHIPCEARPDKVSCVYLVVDIVNEVKANDQDSAGDDSDSTGD